MLVLAHQCDVQRMTLDFLVAENEGPNTSSHTEVLQTPVAASSGSPETENSPSVMVSPTLALTTTRSVRRQTSKTLAGIQALNGAGASSGAPTVQVPSQSDPQSNQGKWLQSIIADPAGMLARTGIELTGKNEVAATRNTRYEGNIIMLAHLVDNLYQRGALDENNVGNSQAADMLRAVRDNRSIADCALVTAEKTKVLADNNELAISSTRKLLEQFMSTHNSATAPDTIVHTSSPFDISRDPLFLNVYEVVKAHTASIDKARNDITSLNDECENTFASIHASQGTSNSTVNLEATVASMQAKARAQTQTSVMEIAALRGETLELLTLITAAQTMINSLRSAVTSMQNSSAGVPPPMGNPANSPSTGVVTQAVSTAPPSLPHIFASDVNARGPSFFASDSNIGGSRSGFFSDGPSSLKRPRPDFAQSYNGQVFTVQYGFITPGHVGPAGEMAKRVLIVAGLTFADSVRYSEYVPIDGGNVLVIKMRALDKAQHLVNTVMNGGCAEFAGKRARIVEGNFVFRGNDMLIPHPNASLTPVQRQSSPPEQLSQPVRQEVLALHIPQIPETAPPRKVSLACWNVNGNIALKMTKPAVRKFVRTCNIIFLSETWLHDGEEDAMKLPRGYNVLTSNRPGAASRNARHGGVAFIYEASLDVTPVDVAKHPDILVVSFADVILVGGYVCPSSSKWEKWCSKAPDVALEEILAYLRVIYPNMRIVVLGDLNARVANKPMRDDWKRSSKDTSTNRRSSWLLDLLEDADLRILNGSTLEAETPGALTCHQAAGSSVVDFILWPASDVPNLQPSCLAVREGPKTTVEGRRVGWSDHSLVKVTFEVAVAERVETAPPISVPGAKEVDCVLARERPAWYAGDGKLDALAIETAACAMSPDDLFAATYGRIHCTVPEVKEVTLAIYLKNDALRSRRGAMTVVYGSREQAKMDNLRIPDWVCYGETAATLYGIAWIVDRTPAWQTVIVYGPGGSFLKLVHNDIVRQSSTGYPAAYAPCAELFVSGIRTRGARVDIRSVRSDAQRVTLKTATRTARDTWRSMMHNNALPTPLASIAVNERPHMIGPFLPGAKLVVATQCRRDKPGERASHTPGAALTGVSLKKTRLAVRSSMAENRLKLVNAGNAGEWWKLVKDILSTKQRPTAVTPRQLRDSFYTRLNPSDSPPPHFDIPLLDYLTQLAATIPSRTVDTSEGDWFSQEWSSEELAAVKKKIASRSAKSAKGFDGVSYKTILSIPNEALARLFNECFDTLDVPTKWLTTTLIGIPKPGKPLSSPESYRLIGLESCLLKVITLLIDARLRKWSDTLTSVPNSQNGFKPKMRTHNNSFLLRVAIEKARGLGKPLHVVFIDLKNAFPSTNMSALWVKMHRAGAGGPLFDWLRMLYQRMTYRVSHEGKMTEAFKSLLGLLTGDSVSPMLWTIFFGDLDKIIPAHPGDIEMAGVYLSHLEQADDVALFSTSLDALQEKLNAFLRWCQINFMTISVSKTKAMTFGPLDRTQRAMRVGGAIVGHVASYKFVGVTFCSTERDIFQLHYATKASKARKVMNTLFSLEGHIGVISVQDGLQLYRAQVDPHLTFGCEVAIDACPASLRLLEREQLAFLRRLLGVSRYSSVAPLFTETGIIPLRFRRIILALGHARYLVQLPMQTLPARAFQEAVSMRGCSISGWIADLEAGVQALGVPVDVSRLNPEVFSNPDHFSKLLDRIYEACDKWLVDQINDNGRLELLAARFAMGHERRSSDRSLANCTLRGYLKVQTLDHRLAITRLLSSQHQLAVEVLRRGDGQRRRPIPRSWRLCRLCQHAVEDEVHAVLGCVKDSRLVMARDRMWGRLLRRSDCPQTLKVDQAPKMEILVKLASWEKGASWFGELVHTVFGIYAEIPLLILTVPDRIWEDGGEDMPNSPQGGDGSIMADDHMDCSYS